MIRRIFFFTIAVCVYGCQQKENMPSGILQPVKMQEVMWDYMRADAYAAEILKKDTAKNDTLENIRLQKMIFSKHKITKADFDKSYEYYVAHPKMMNTILDSISAKQNRANKGKVYFGTN
jgi:hypothetical protein